jgi:hypothetical protein
MMKLSVEQGRASMRKRAICWQTQLLVALFSCLVSPALADWKDDIGFTKLKAEVGGTLETGAGVVVAMAEAYVSGNYLPNLGNSQFAGKTLTDASGLSSGTSSHANTVAQLFFGNTASISGGVTNVTLYQADDWLENKMGWKTGPDPVTQPFHIINHSWIGNSTNNGEMVDALMRVDHMVHRDDVLVIAGTSNSGSTVPDLLGHGYNAMVVGRSSGVHGAGTTTFNGSGRTRPDIVAPGASTSAATPMVSSAAALIRQAVAGTDGARSETMRAILMAGATKNEFASWDRTVTRPLDEVYGAGELNVYNSYQIVQGGQFAGVTVEPTFSVGISGWDYVDSLQPNDTLYYNFTVANNQLLSEFSVSLNWNLEVNDLDSSTNTFAPEALLANMSLRLFDSSDTFLGSLLDASLSPVDNLEHLYMRGLGAGTYTLAVNTDRATDMGIAWRGTLTAVPEPNSMLAIAFVASGFLLRRRKE